MYQPFDLFCGFEEFPKVIPVLINISWRFHSRCCSKYMYNEICKTLVIKMTIRTNWNTRSLSLFVSHAHATSPKVYRYNSNGTESPGPGKYMSNWSWISMPRQILFLNYKWFDLFIQKCSDKYRDIRQIFINCRKFFDASIEFSWKWWK